MILKADCIANRLELGHDTTTLDPLVITPEPVLRDLRESGSASVDLRLGTWFVTLRQARMSHLSIFDTTSATQLTKSHYVPFGGDYLLHPRNFVLGVTLEWVRIPKDLAGYVTAKSSWGRRGLIIATATGVHPGFTGCLTLELTNLGEIPIALKPGMTISQLFLHDVKSDDPNLIDHSRFMGRRKPIVGGIKYDPIAEKLAATNNADSP